MSTLSIRLASAASPSLTDLPKFTSSATSRSSLEIGGAASRLTTSRAPTNEFPACIARASASRASGSCSSICLKRRLFFISRYAIGIHANIIADSAISIGWIFCNPSVTITNVDKPRAIPRTRSEYQLKPDWLISTCKRCI